MKLYWVKVNIYEEATGYKYPVVSHVFYGKTRKEAWNYHESHRKSDSFLKQCEDLGAFQKRLKCRVVITEGKTREL